MRATRALVGAFGAGISLAVAASVALLVVSSVIAFRGWPDDVSGGLPPEIAQLSQAAERPVTTSAPAVALPKAAVLTASARPGGTLRPVAVAGRGLGAPLASSARPVTGSGGSPTSVAAQPGPKVAAPVHQTAGAVTDTTTAVSQVVAPASPQAASALESVGAAGAEVADQVGQTVNRVVGGLLPAGR